MADVKIVVEEKLGGQFSFGGKEIKVLKATYDAVPQDKQSEFEETLIKAQEVYQAKVAEAKKAGQRPQASKLKSEAIIEVINPFLEANSVTKGSIKKGGVTRVVKPTVGSKELHKRAAESPTDKESLRKEFDDFPADILDDSSEETAEATETRGDFDDLEDELGLDDVLGEEDEDVFGSGSQHADPFDAPSGDDPFDDFDLDI